MHGDGIFLIFAAMAILGIPGGAAAGYIARKPLLDSLGVGAIWFAACLAVIAVVGAASGGNIFNLLLCGLFLLPLPFVLGHALGRWLRNEDPSPPRTDDLAP